MAQKKTSPTVELVFERFRLAMTEDEAIPKGIVERVFSVLEGEGAVTPVKFTDALFGTPNKNEPKNK